MTTTDAVLLPTQAQIEALYSGSVGDDYVKRNPTPNQLREPFWRAVLEETGAQSVLEVGCGIGSNLSHMLHVPTLYGVDVHQPSLDRARENTQGKAKLYKGSATALPFPQRSIELVITSGLLIHIAQDALPRVVKEIGRVSSQYVLLVEYMDSHRRVIPWHGHNGILFADVFGLTFWRHNSNYTPVWKRHLTKAQGFDRTEAVLYRRREGM